MISKKSTLAYISIFIWPFIFYFPLSSGFIAMGNDFDLIYFAYKKYIFEFWQEGELPFWSPSEGAGFTLVYNPFAQFFYLPSWILFIICDLKGTFSLQDYLIYTLFGISIYSFGQYQWLKNLKISTNKNCLLISLIVPTILIVSNFLRLPNAIQTFCWIPYLLLGINYSFNSQKTLKSFFFIFFSTLFIFTAGYPYFIIYIFILSVIYFFFISFSKIENLSNFFTNFFKCLLPSVISLIFSSPWLLGVYKTLSLTQDRNQNDYNYATGSEFNLIDIIGSWIYPITSNTEGRYYFGIIFTFIIIIFLINIFKEKLFLKKNQKKILLFIFITFVITSILSMSEKTFFFKILWNNIELIQNMRVWPRINIILVPTLSLLGLLALDSFLKKNETLKSKKNQIKQYNIILILILIFQFYFFFTNSVDSYWQTWHQKRFIFAKENLAFPLNEIIMLSDGKITILSTIILILFLNTIFMSKFFIEDKLKKNFLIVMLLFISFEQFLNSNLQWSLKKWKTDRTSVEYLANNKFDDNFNKPRIKKIVHGNNYFRDDAFTINNFLNWGNEKHNKIYWEYFDKYGREISNIQKSEYNYVYRFFGLDNQNKKIFFSDNILENNIINFVKLAENFEKKKIHKYIIKKINNNSITIEFDAIEDGWIIYIDNNDPYWKAYLNKNIVKIYNFKDTYKSVKFNKGKNVLVFKYEPFNF